MKGFFSCDEKVAKVFTDERKEARLLSEGDRYVKWVERETKKETGVLTSGTRTGWMMLANADINQEKEDTKWRKKGEGRMIRCAGSEATMAAKCPSRLQVLEEMKVKADSREEGA